MLKNFFVQNSFKPERQESARKDDPVDANGTENRCRMQKLFNFEFRQFQEKNGSVGLWK